MNYPEAEPLGYLSEFNLLALSNPEGRGIEPLLIKFLLLKLFELLSIDQFKTNDKADAQLESKAKYFE